MPSLDALHARIISHPDNAAVLALLEVADSLPAHLRAWDGGASFDEGGQVFLNKWSASLPDDCKYSLSIHNLLVEPITGRVFAFHWGRFTFVARVDLERAGLKDEPRLRVGLTLDDHVDFRALGPGWVLLNNFIEDEAEQLEWAHALATRSR